MPLLIHFGLDNYARAQTVDTRPFLGQVGPGNEAIVKYTVEYPNASYVVKAISYTVHHGNKGNQSVETPQCITTAFHKCMLHKIYQCLILEGG